MWWLMRFMSVAWSKTSSLSSCEKSFRGGQTSGLCSWVPPSIQSCSHPTLEMHLWWTSLYVQSRIPWLLQLLFLSHRSLCLLATCRFLHNQDRYWVSSLLLRNKRWGFPAQCTKSLAFASLWSIPFWSDSSSCIGGKQFIQQCFGICRGLCIQWKNCF